MSDLHNKFDESEQNRLLSDVRRREEEDLAHILSGKHGVKYINLSGIPIEAEALKLIPETTAREAKIAAFSLVGKQVRVAVVSPLDPKTQAVIENLRKNGYIPVIFMVSHPSLEKAWSRYADIDSIDVVQEGLLAIGRDDFSTFKETYPDTEAIQQLLNKSLTLEAKTTELIETILASAVVLGASDVHIEPQEEDVQIRMRLDGVLVEMTDTTHDLHEKLISRIKLLSGLKLNVRSEPQDGRFSINLGEEQVEVRTSILPGAFGESIVMRLLNPDAAQVSIETLGIHKALLEIVRKELSKPNGLILTTGPTGSGKTTALYAFLKQVYRPGIKIITIENPVEYHLDGIVQTQVDKSKGYDFYDGLRSALRQDPDVIMVGEIRDENTAKTAVQASLTGHLVFSTLHTNDAAGAIPRMRDLDVELDVLGSSLNLILAQRLVRKLNPDYSEERPLTEQEHALIEKVMHGVDPNVYTPFLERGMVRQPIKGTSEGMSYQGRIGVFEGIVIDNATEELIRKNAPLQEIEQVGMYSRGILSMAQAGVLLVLQGITDFGELSRVINLDR